MKKAFGALRCILLILFLILLVGCVNPVNESNKQAEKPVSNSEYKALQDKYNALQFNYDSLKRASIDSKEMLDKYNGMINDLQVLRVENAALKGQLQTLTGQYQNAVNALTSSQKSGLKSLEDMDKQLRELNKILEDTIVRHKTVDGQIQLVRDKKVKLLSDNLTDAEYSAFYKGWNLWWGTFNESSNQQ